MKIINRIMVSSVLLVFLSLAFLLTAISIIFLLSPGDPGKELLDKDVFHVADMLDEFDASARDWDSLNTRLGQYSYKLLVIDDDLSLIHISEPTRPY